MCTTCTESHGALGLFPVLAFSDRTAVDVTVWAGSSSGYSVAAVRVDAGVGATEGVRTEAAVASVGGAARGVDGRARWT